jgi:Calcium binding
MAIANWMVFMAKVERDAEREERIIMAIVADAYGPEEQAMGWYHQGYEFG